MKPFLRTTLAKFPPLTAYGLWLTASLSFLPFAAFSANLTLIQANAGKHNVWFWVHGPEHEAVAASVRFTDAATGRLVYEWRGSWDGQRPAWHTCSLAPGTYDVRAMYGASQVRQRFTCRAADPQTGLFMSDLVLAKAPFERLPEARPVVENGVPVAGWLGVRIQSLRPEPLALRAVLHRRGFEATLAETFVPVREQATVLPPRPETVWNMPLDVAALEEGEYRLEIWLYRGESLVGRRTLQFVRPWAGDRQIRADVRTAIDQMRYIFPARVCDSLVRLGDPAAMYAGWQHAWEERYGAQAQAEIRTYYTRMAGAVARFGSWRCQRAAVFVRYGAPTATRRTGADEVWRYRFGEVTLAP